MEDMGADTNTHVFLPAGNASTRDLAGRETTPTEEKAVWSYLIFVVSQYLWKVFPPVVILFGTFGNVMTIVIMRQMTSGDATINIYFTAIAVLDLIILWINTFSLWLYYLFQIKISAGHTAVCKLHTWMYTGIGTMSAWCLVCMTVHRAMSVVWPHRVNSLCTRRTVLLVITGIVVCFAGLYSHYLLGFERRYINGEYWCTVGPDESYVYFSQHVFVYIELVVYSLLPFLLLAASNTILVWKLGQSVKAAGRKLTQGDSEQVQAREKAARSVTLTVVLVSVAFLVFTLPNSLDFIVNFLSQTHNTTSGYERAQSTFITAVCGMLGNINYAVNFYLYCLTGRRFREEFLKIMRCGWGSRRQLSAPQ